MDWKRFVTDLASRRAQIVSFREPASADELDRLQIEFGFRLPNQYRELMLQTNGIFDEYSCAILDDAAWVLSVNRDVRSDSHLNCMPLDHLFFISSVFGNGDLLGYGIRRDNWAFPALYRWDHEDDSRNWEAPDLKTWLEWAYRGQGGAEQGEPADPLRG